MLVLELIQIWCNVRKYGTVDKLDIVVHQNQIDYHPKVHDNEMDD